MIRDAAVYGDFFSTLDASAICAALIGCPYDRNAVLASLRCRASMARYTVFPQKKWHP